MRNCGGITHVKEANLINFLFYVLCVLPLCTWLLWKDDSLAKRTKESLENLFYIYINRNKINRPVQILAALSREVQHVNVSIRVPRNMNTIIYHDGNGKHLSGRCVGGLTGLRGFIKGPRSSSPSIGPSINSFRRLAATTVVYQFVFQFSDAPQRLFIGLLLQDLSPPVCQNNFPPLCNIPSRRVSFR